MATEKEAVLSRYLGQHGLKYQEKNIVPEEMYASVARVRAEKLQPYIAPNSNVLEYGVGLGYNLAQLDCHEKLGFDIAEFLCSHLAARDIPFVSRTAHLDESSFDVIICHHVLEHTASPWVVLREMYRLLRPGGTLLLFVPYEKERMYRRFNCTEKNGHLFSWNPQTLGALAQGAGWSIQTIRLALFGYDRFAASVAHHLGLGEQGYRFIRRVLLFARPRYEIRAVLKKPA
jgi:SAM-dependent methyltransferase